MPALAGVLSGRQAAGSVAQTGTTFAPVPLLDPTGAATTLVPANGVEYLVLSWCNMVASSNAIAAEARCVFGSEVLARNASTMRFSTFGGNVSRGSAHAGLALITGNGADAVAIEQAADGATDANCNGADLQLIPTSALEDFSFVDDTDPVDPEAAVDTPVEAWTNVGAPLTFSPAEDGAFVVLAYLELFGNGGDTGANEFAARLVVSVDGGPEQVVQVSNHHDREANFAAGVCRHNYRFHTFPDLNSGATYTYRLQANGTDGGGNIPARRVRLGRFRQSSFGSVTEITSTAGIDVAAAAAQVDVLPGSSATIPDPGEAGIVHLFLGDTRSQTTAFTTLRANLDSGASFLPRDGGYRGNDANGTAAASDICHIHLQGSQVLSPGADHAIQLEAEHFSGGVVTYARDRGNANHVPVEFAVIALQAPTSSTTEIAIDVVGEGGGSLDVESTTDEVVADAVGEAEATVALSQATLLAVDAVGAAESTVALVFETLLAVDAVGEGESSVALSFPGLTSVVVDAVGAAEATVVLEQPTALQLDAEGDGTATVVILGAAAGFVVGPIGVSSLDAPAPNSAGNVVRAWVVHREDEGHAFEHRAMRPREESQGQVIQAEQPVDLSGVTAVATEYLDGSAWTPIPGVGEVVTTEENGQTWHWLRFRPADGALESVVAAAGRAGTFPMRWALTVGDGDLHAPTTGHTSLHILETPS